MLLFNHFIKELNSRIDDFSQDVIIPQLELLLNFNNRFYMRQFITRKAVNKTMLQKLKETLDEYFYYRKAIKLGIPTVQCIARQLNLFPSYSSDILRPVTGQNARQQIHNKPIEKAKEILSASDL